MGRTHPPAWYRDPGTSDQLRRWDGRAWTDDVRPHPAWLEGLRPAPGPPAKRPVARRAVIVRRLWTASSITLAFALVLLLSLVSSIGPSPTAVSAERVSDEDFLAAASETCTRANRTVLEPYRRSASANPEALATAVEEFVDELRSIDVVPGDQERVARWIAAWDAWTDAGHRYAEAKDDGDQERADEITKESHVARAAISQFSYANGLGACAL